jgi:PTS system fructose-specific IIA component/PTS system nitrogen regulatory IIA component
LNESTKSAAQSGPLVPFLSPVGGPSFDPSRLAEEFDFLTLDAVMPELQVSSKEEAIRTMVADLVRSKAIPAVEQESVAAAILRREGLAPTGIGHGIAIPHTKHAAVTRMVVAVAHSPQGVDFDSWDGEAVHLIFLLVSPPGQTREHLLALEAISRRLAQRTS